ncbi:MAG: ribonuclease HII [Acutalibacteraceae bacterium]|nr:ribonuclease HII [Acutalibacteraceae bacterium]
MPDYSFEIAAQQKGFSLVCGVDEAGRGPLAGPVCAAAVILPQGLIIEGLDDSKKLTEKKREALFDVIKENAVAYGIAFADVDEIEEHNILGATYIAMFRAVEALNIKPDYVLIDGNRYPPQLDIKGETVVKGDSKSMSIAAASILAKVTRDRLLLQYAEKYPQYSFEKHKGYGTKAHIEAIKKYGITEIHRPSFLKKLL